MLSERKDHVCRGLIVLGIFYVYWPLLFYGWLEIEDSHYYFRNPYLTKGNVWRQIIEVWRNAPQSNWIPLTWMVAIGIKSCFGFSAFVFHLCSISLHTINSLLVYRMCHKIGLDRLFVVFVTAVFALHPMQVESVAWVSSMKGLLSATFALLALTYAIEHKTELNLKFLSAVFLLSLLSKQTLLALPLVLLFFSGSSHSLRIPAVRSVVKFVPLCLLSLGGVLVIFWANTDHPYFHALDFWWQYPLRALSALGHYFCKSVYPVALHPEYQWSESIGLLIVSVSLLLLTASLAIKQHPAGLYLLACILLIAPVLGWSTSPLEFAADRLFYLPLVFLLIALCYGLQTLSKSQAIHVLGVMIILACGVRSASQLETWKSDATLCHHILNHTSDHFLAKINLGLIHARNGDFDLAEPVLRENLIEHPERIESVRSLSQVLFAKGQPDEAVQVVEGAQKDVRDKNAYFILLATTYYDSGNIELAIQSLHKLLEKEPSHALAQKLLGEVKAQQQ